MALNNQKEIIRIVLLGKTGVGKSATGNTILGKEVFGVKCSPESVTRKCAAGDATVYGQRVTVIDTPGLYDTLMKPEELKKEIEALFNYSSEGIHAFLLVIKLGSKLTEEERKAVQWIKDNFGEEASKNTILLFTNGEGLNNGSITDYINEGKQLQMFVNECNNRYQVFKNLINTDRTQVVELLEKIKTMIQENNNKLYTKEEYEKNQNKLRALGYTAGGIVGTGVSAGAAAAYGVTAFKLATAAAAGGIVGVGAVGAVGAVSVGTAIYRAICKALNKNPEHKNKDK